ncbi:063L [Cherax quadricarinatus iridovirus]|uniref:Transcription elongation factor SII n=1 Tax=Shrimp hemocyte iridescent virus TaxID=2039780 RepID=A0A291B0S8_9VIRU|nr:063L [Cherax quadricarinatus iridovirus]YP_010084840.1 transcription elongation factor SII [Shrimp hemocyte iridescent virus]UPA43381.1 transcription elongation factor SII [Iridovirus CN01]ASZ85043.1 063L [Cherax quadricarinatus iridovirus]ATE87097.1 transcription elongation factor SII [Shrimp hemocyte iridescent virus]UPA43457.1 transcription elongation factor SII [Iridovirus CN01]UPA43651.1 transcription elongation factor SII [Iridovirus CN01]
MNGETISQIKTYLKKYYADEDEEWIWSQIYEDLSEEPDLNEYIENVVKAGKLGWNHKTFNKIKQTQEEQDDYIVNPFEAEEGVVQCKKCKSFKVYSISVQTRAADEPMTTVAQCTVCKAKWSYNG